MSVTILVGDCMVRLAEIPDNSLDSCVTDGPYHLSSIVKRFGAKNAAPAKVGKTGAYARASAGFMGQKWDGGDICFRVETWREIFRVLKPGAHLVAFSGTRTYHRMAVAIEDAGFEIRDMIGWLYGSGFPKSHDISKAIDKKLGAKRTEKVGSKLGQPGKSKDFLNQRSGFAAAFGGEAAAPMSADILAPATPEAERWDGWGTALKPAQEPICLARKPLIGSVAANVLKHGTGALNIDASRIETADELSFGSREIGDGIKFSPMPKHRQTPGERSLLGRWPANIVHDGSAEVLAAFPDTSSGGYPPAGGKRSRGATYGEPNERGEPAFSGSSGSAARFFYTAKADSGERHGGCHDLEKRNGHPTVKPIDLMHWLVRLVTPPGGTVLDPFLGSGSTAIAADAAQMNCIGCELSPEYAAIAERRLTHQGGIFAEVTISPAPLPAGADHQPGSEEATT